MRSPDMAMVLKRLLTLGLALTFLVGVTEQLMPSSMAMPQMTASADMGGRGVNIAERAEFVLRTLAG